MLRRSTPEDAAAFVQAIDDNLMITLIDDNWCIRAMTRCGAGIMGFTEPKEIIGVNFSEATSERLPKLMFEDKLLAPIHDYPSPTRDVLKPVADSEGIAVGWLWVVHAQTGKMSRIASSLRKLSEGYLLECVLLEDPTNKCWEQIVDEKYVCEQGVHFTTQEMTIVEEYMSGATYEQMATAAGCSPTTAKRLLNRIITDMNFESPADLREYLWQRHSEEFMVSPRQMVVGVPSALSKIPENP